MLLHVHVGCEAQPSVESGFPLSEFLKERHFKLSRNATMVAQQAANKIASENKVQYLVTHRLFSFKGAIVCCSSCGLKENCINFHGFH